MLITFPNTPVSTDGHFAVETSLDLRDISGKYLLKIMF